MPGARRRTTSQPPLTLGFAGSGQLDAKATVALLDDLIDGREVSVVYLPLTNDDTTDEIIHVQRWCLEKEIPYEVVSNEAEVKKDKTLKKILDGAEGDYEAQEQGAGKDIVELLAGTEEEPVEDGRLLLFLDPDQDVDLDVYAHSQEHDVPAFDMCGDLTAITEEGADGGDPEPEPEPPAVTDISTRRGRGRVAAAEPEPPADDDKGEEQVAYTTAEKRALTNLKKETLVELKKKAKALDPENITTESLRGTDKDYVADLIVVTKRNQAAEAAVAASGDDGEPDEAQQTTKGRGRGRQSAAEPSEEPTGDDGDGEDPASAVFARLRASRERAEHITKTLTRAMQAIVDEGGEPDEVIERAAGAVAASLMLFAEYLIVEIRKPKSAGRPRADGSEAQPKPPADPDAPKRGRGRPRRSE